ncbi:hypothetical protein [Stenotrophomonas sp. 24(2023)]|uniref:hypothetical protein n=1 Tax=Stenotrophomonas sp. 24(2023) TaxID=3068324 RepID=UPI0027E07310|nr:hypothetical protein [Stenotrophomonas sp. 24(2023)]WMJ69692.1 hypothetical protein Q9R17_00860 [Stenotrophomonas sp. 24(2023)]
MQRIPAVLSGLLLSAAVGAQPPPAVRITVAYEWSGWGHEAGTWIIERGHDGVDRRQDVGTTQDSADRVHVLPASAVDALLAATDGPAPSRESVIAQLAAGLDRDAVARLDPTVRSFPAAACTYAVQQAWVRRVLTDEELRRRVEQIVSGLWTDDYPVMTVTVQQQGRPPITFFSHAQGPAMLPWKQVPAGETDPQTLEQQPDQWRIDLSRAVDGLLPLDMGSRARFQPSWLQRQVGMRLQLDAQACGKPRGR